MYFIYLICLMVNCALAGYYIQNKNYVSAGFVIAGAIMLILLFIKTEIMKNV